MRGRPLTRIVIGAIPRRPFNVHSTDVLIAGVFCLDVFLMLMLEASVARVDYDFDLILLSLFNHRQWHLNGLLCGGEIILAMRKPEMTKKEVLICSQSASPCYQRMRPSTPRTSTFLLCRICLG